MSRSVYSLALVAICTSLALASVHAASSQTEPGNSALSSGVPVAYVYVSSSLSTGKSQINAFAAASNGSLATVSGSPFATTDSYLAVNGNWLFGTDGINIDSFSIALNGSLSLKDSYTAGNSGGGPSSLLLDHTGVDLYDGFANLDGTGNNGYQSYSINQTTGQISYINDISGGPSIGGVLSFIGNNQYAYSSSCYHFTPSIYGVQRQSDGAITELSINPALPATKTPGFYCPWSRAAADPTTHVAVAMQPLDSNWQADGPYQLATYTADSTGNLTTTSTYSNMPTTEVATLPNGSVTDYWMSPSGKFLAVAGTSGLQIFHFNGASPITKYTNRIVSQEVDQVFWDNSNHLYAIGTIAGKLWVFTVTSTSVSQAPGSPHRITVPHGLIVLPK
jgi:hypothetical protein